MKEVGYETTIVLLILLPGFLCARIVQMVCVRSEQSDLDKIAEALLYSFVVYVVSVALPIGPPITLRAHATPDGTDYWLAASPSSLMSITGLAILLALAIGYLETNDVLGRMLRWLRITQRSARASIWSDVFHTVGGFVQVELQDGRTIVGWIRLYSDRPDESSLFLEDAAWINENLEEAPVPGPGVFLTKDSGIKTIVFLNAIRTSGPLGLDTSVKQQTRTPVKLTKEE